MRLDHFAGHAALLLTVAAAGLTSGCAATTQASRAATAGAPLDAADSALVGRILVAEDRRDSTDAALAAGAAHGDARVRLLAVRARGRIRDSIFAGRDSFPMPRAPIAWPEPAWRLRYRALAAQRTDCTALRNAMRDESLPVRLRAADFVTAACSGDDALTATLRQWVDSPDAGRGGWHASAHGIVALARARPIEARVRAPVLSRHGQWQVRMYAARAAAVLSDTVLLRALARDPNDNVKEAAIDALAKLTPGDRATFIAGLGANGAQAVRAAAIALKGTTDPVAIEAARTTFERWVARGNESERDARVALLEAAGRSARDDRPPAPRHVLPPRAVALALGADVRLRVHMAPASGGGTFTVRLRGDAAPMMAARILELARAGYYDGNDWHRVEHDFVIQGGGPGSNEYVGLASYLRDELGTIPHVRGTVGMSTRGHDSGDAQWFINLKDNLRLARDFTIFAEVIDGIDVVDGVLEGDVIARIEEIAP